MFRSPELLPTSSHLFRPSFLLQLDRNTFQVTLLNRDAIRVGADCEWGRTELMVIQGTQDLLGLTFDLLFLSGNKGNDIAQDVQRGNAWIAGA